MTTIQDIIIDTLSSRVNQHGRLIAFNRIGYKITLYGYIRKVCPDHIDFEDNETGTRFKIKNVISFDPVKLKILK